MLDMIIQCVYVFMYIDTYAYILVHLTLPVFFFKQP